MCFGMTTTQQTNQTANGAQGVWQTGNNSTSATANPAVAAAALNNLDAVQGLQKQGFQGYWGPQVASIDPKQQSTINSAFNTANNGTGANATSLIDQYANAGPQSVTANTIESQMSPYMNQYVMQALAPQLQQMDIANAKTNQQTDALATSRGAFGDARQGVEAANNAFNQNVAREGVIGNAYNHAFDTAISAGSTDASNKLAASNANAGYNEQALARALGGSNALQGLQTQQLGALGTANSLTQQNTANNQANLTAMYNQWLMAQQYPFQTAGLVNSTIGQAASAMPASTNTSTSSEAQTRTAGSNAGTTQAPNNSGWGALGTIAGLALAPFTGGTSLGLAGLSGLSGLLGGGGGQITYGGPNGPTAFGNVAV